MNAQPTSKSDTATDVDVERPIFVCGVGRSGTSLVQSMLAANSQIAVLPETAMLRRHVLGRRLEKLWRRGGVEAVRAKLDADQRVEHLGVNIDALLDQFAEKETFSDANLYRQLLHEFGRKQGRPRVADKDPRLIEHLPVIKRLFPEAYVLHVVRDPRDVLASKKKAAWSKGRSSWRHIFANRVQFRLGRRDGPKHFGDRYVEVLYEQLIANPEETLQRLCRQTDVPYEGGMLAFSGAAAGLVRPEERAWKQETLGPLLQDNSGRWRSQLTPWEILLTEAACRDALEATAADQQSPRQSASTLMTLQATAATASLCVLEWVYRAYLKTQSA